MTSSIAAAGRNELPRILEMLEEADLPLAGVEDARELLVAREGERLVGCVGLEVYEDVGLLRSLVVRPDARGTGVGQRLVAGILDDARERGVTALYLLTTTADAYFPKFGFAPIPREEVDPRLQQSAELRGACPDTAVCMRKRL